LSAAAVANKVIQRRRVGQPPTKIRHLNDQLVNKLISKTEKACIQVANVTQPSADVDLGRAFTATMVVTITNVPRVSLHGGNDRLTLMERPTVRIINPGGDRAEEILLSALQRRRSSSVGIVPDDVVPSVFDDADGILMITSGEELNADSERNKLDRAKARVETEDEIEENLEGMIAEVLF
jgi:hypothetical protein